MSQFILLCQNYNSARIVASVSFEGKVKPNSERLRFDAILALDDVRSVIFDMDHISAAWRYIVRVIHH